MLRLGFALGLFGLTFASCVDPEAHVACQLTECGGECVDVDKSRDHCGTCGNACALGETCSAGSCEPGGESCSGDLTECDGDCIDTSDDPENCGDCGTVCDAGESCVDGVCDSEPPCDGGMISCDGDCIDPASNPLFCGASDDCQGANAGTACESDEVCDRGSCALECLGGLVNCDGACIDPNTDNDHCGASGDCQGPNAGEVCSGTFACNGAGACELECDGGTIACGGNCIDPMTNPLYCGATGDCQAGNDGTACSPNAICGTGTCNCQAPFFNQGGRCAREYLLPDTAWVIGTKNDCGNGNFHTSGGAAYGFQFADVPGAATTVTSIELQMATGLTCSGADQMRTLQVNGVAASSYVHPFNGGCTCSATQTVVNAAAFSTANYTVGGTNAITILNPVSNEGHSRNAGWGNALWRVVVTY